MPKLLILLIRGYQKSLGLLLGGQCRFHPSCSHYAIEAIDKHGSIKGSVLSAYRILRCAPWSKGGLDPVPEPHSHGHA